MRIIRIGYGIRGFGRITDWAIRSAYMVQKEAEQKLRILAFFEKHGLAATIEAFKVSRRSLYGWKAKLKAGQGKTQALNNASRKPKKVRTRVWPKMVMDEIRRLRREHPNLGKDKIRPLLRRFYEGKNLACPSVVTIGRIIADAPDKMRTFPVKVRHDGTIVQRKRQKKARKPKGFIATYPGHCGSFDTVERFVDGCRRYVITFTDTYSRFCFAWATTSHGSQAAKEVFSLVTEIFPYPLSFVLTDNGSEFMKHFDAEVRRLHKTHWHTYPKTPKMNAHCERFNRTIQEEFVDFHTKDLLSPDVFNQKLMGYLIWYNGERPHWSLNLKSPIQFLTEQNPKECNMWWAHTRS